MSAPEAVYVYRDNARTAAPHGAWRWCRVVGDVVVGDEPLQLPVLATTSEAIDAARRICPDAVSVARGEPPQPADQPRCDLARVRKLLAAYPGLWEAIEEPRPGGVTTWEVYDAHDLVAVVMSERTAQALCDLRDWLASAVREIEHLRAQLQAKEGTL